MNENKHCITCVLHTKQWYHYPLSLCGERGAYAVDEVYYSPYTSKVRSCVNETDVSKLGVPQGNSWPAYIYSEMSIIGIFRVGLKARSIYLLLFFICHPVFCSEFSNTVRWKKQISKLRKCMLVVPSSSFCNSNNLSDNYTNCIWWGGRNSWNGGYW